MTKMAGALAPSLRRHVESPPSEGAEQILDQLEAASGGHNGIWVEGAAVSERNELAGRSVAQAMRATATKKPAAVEQRASDRSQDLAVPAIAGKLALPSCRCGRYIRGNASNWRAGRHRLRRRIHNR